MIVSVLICNWFKCSLCGRFFVWCLDSLFGRWVCFCDLVCFVWLICWFVD